MANNLDFNTSYVSKFTYANLDALQRGVSTNPLRIIAHIDLDAFYAQCESIRLGLSHDVPVACLQWDSLIAVNYSARAFGIQRHEKLIEAKKKCPNLVAVHVATWKRGEDSYRYHEQPDSFTHKACLDPYRQQSKLIFDIFNRNCPRVEYGGIDEAFLDLSSLVYDKASRLYPRLFDNLAAKRSSGELDLPLFMPGLTFQDLTWVGNLLPVSQSFESKLDSIGERLEFDLLTREVDWDEVLISLATQIVAEIRSQVFSELKFTCTAGIAPNRTLAKLCSAYRKPNQQNILRSAAVSNFLHSVPFTKFRGLGGKLGDSIAKHFDVPEQDSVGFLLGIPQYELVRTLGDETGTWLFNLLRGQDFSEIKTRSQSRSMLAAKNLRPPVECHDELVQWLRTFSADIYGRICEFAAVESSSSKLEEPHNKPSVSIPKTIGIHVLINDSSWSKQIPFPACQPENLLDTIFHSAVVVLKQIESQRSIYPCRQLNLTVYGFNDTVAKNHTIDSFLKSRSAEGDEFKLVPHAVEPESDRHNQEDTAFCSQPLALDFSDSTDESHDHDSFICPECQQLVKFADIEEHTDWHYARLVEKQLAAKPSTSVSSAAANHKHTISTPNSSSSQFKKKQKLEKGQRRLL
ncbi:uncharacterized protein V1516DRAFT_526249 [Lipomyces oligophaga]|uniref:uncharacterized protein n=1 Tax=Lipomyces oligophaga TaxID=45792 RepID=UPI0034CD7A2C